MRQGSKRRVAPTGKVDPLDDVVASVVSYARQETVVPLRGAGRWLAYGIVAAVFVGLSTVMFVLGALRLLQDVAGGVFDGAWSFVPYLVCFVLAVVLTGLALSRVGGSELNKRAFDGGGAHG